MKEILLATQPKWCEAIGNKIKVIDIRKTAPKIELPFKVYIYCTYGDLLRKGFPNEQEVLKVKDYLKVTREKQVYFALNGRVIGEFICDKIDNYTAKFVNDGEWYEDIRRKWIDDDGEEDFEIITSNDKDNPEDCELLKNSCLAYAELKKYIGENFHDIPFYGWHISNVTIYDKPKALREFYTRCKVSENKCKLCDNCFDREDGFGHHYAVKQLTRPPQSWCFVET